MLDSQRLSSRRENRAIRQRGILVVAAQGCAFERTDCHARLAGRRGGFFVQDSDFGVRSSDRFAVLPQLSGQVGMDVANNFRVHIGHDFLYVSDVVRPGDQIDRRINFIQQPVPVGGGALIGTALPAPLFNHNDFWAHGNSAGVTLRF
jgi:hypothetical protein